mmetsp:Transcript_66990/g.125157  ORF Transcript_66990/g.125157 Transcript_66990/m.125157 type:complete len:281 (+) Transcript_66990:88-930(+)
MMLQALQRQLETELGPDSEKDVFVLIVDRVNTGAHTTDDGERSGKWRTRLSSKAAPFVPNATPKVHLADLISPTYALPGQAFMNMSINTEPMPVNDCPEQQHWSDESYTTGLSSFATVEEVVQDEEDTISTEGSIPPTTSLPIKHTFIHYEDSPAPGVMSRSASAPALLMNKAINPIVDVNDEDDEDQLEEQVQNEASQMTLYEKAMAHEHGECRPCAFFLYKEDGCRWGDSCSFCHLCPKGEIKARRKMMRYATQRAQRVKAKSAKQPQTRVLLLQQQL